MKYVKIERIETICEIKRHFLYSFAYFLPEILPNERLSLVMGRIIMGAKILISMQGSSMNKISFP